MNKKIKTLIKLGVLCFGVSVILNNCEKSTISEEEVLYDLPKNVHQGFIITTTSFSEEDNTLKKLRHNYNIDNAVRSIQSEGNTQSKTSTGKSIIAIDTSVIKKITRGSYTSYTMRIASIDGEPSTFYNITFEEVDGITSMFVTQYKNFDKHKSAKGSLASKSGISSSIATKRIDDLAEPIGPEDLGNEGGSASSGGSGGGGGTSTTYPTDCDGWVTTTTIAIETPCGCGHSWNQLLNGTCIGCSSMAPRWPSLETTVVYECEPIGSGSTGSGTDGNTSGGSSGTGDSNIDISNTSLTTPIDDDCNALNLTLNEGYSIKSPFKVDLSDFYPTGCNNIDTSSVALNERFICVYNKLTESPKFKTLFLDTFGENENINVKFEIVDNIATTPPSTTEPHGNAGAKAKLNPDGTLAELNVTIKINKSKMGSVSAISLARTILHESIHAYLHLKHLDCNQGTPINEILNISNDKSLAELLNSYYETGCPRQEQHEFMFDHMIPTMSEILKDIKDDLVPLNHQRVAETDYTFIDESNPSGSEKPWNWDDFYKYFSIAGLQNSDAFQFEMLPETSPKHKNFMKYSSVGTNGFSKDCND